MAYTGRKTLTLVQAARICSRVRRWHSSGKTSQAIAQRVRLKINRLSTSTYVHAASVNHIITLKHSLYPVLRGDSICDVLKTCSNSTAH